MTADKLKAYAVTLEYYTTNYLVVPVEARSVREAIDLAYQTDSWDSQDTYDDCGDTYVGYVAEFDTIEDAESAGTLEGDALPIPFEDKEPCIKADIIEKERDELRAMLERLIEWDAGMGNHESAVWTDARLLYASTRKKQFAHECVNPPHPAT